MNIAYLILAHKNATQVNRLINSLKGPGTSFIIHIDDSADIDEFICTTAGNSARILFVEDRVSCLWGTFSIVQATINSLIFIQSNVKEADRVVLLSGQDYPIKSRQYIDDFFAAKPAAIFMNYFTIPYENWSMGGVFRFPNFEKVNAFMTIYGGSQWWSMPMDVVREVLLLCDKYPVFGRYFSKVNIPDESFFQTLIFNAGDAVSHHIVNDNLKFTFWDLPDNNRSILNIHDFDLLKESKGLFARKFDEKMDDAILNKIDVEFLSV